jgi:probable O-glycosylation ligase (exosortase A-associated)
MAAVGLFFWLKSRNKVMSLLLLLALAVLGLSFMPETWHQRMATIQTYQEDRSAMGRINAWAYSINVANDRLTGAGFESWSEFTFAIYAPNPEAVHAGHSIFFSVLADHGWLGLLLFLAILWLSWRNLGRIIGQTEHEDPMNLLARMLQVSLIAYMSGGAFLSLSYFDLPWHIFAIIVLLTEFLKQKTPCEQVARSQSFRPRRYGALAPQSGGHGRS